MSPANVRDVTASTREHGRHEQLAVQALQRKWIREDRMWIYIKCKKKKVSEHAALCDELVAVKSQESTASLRSGGMQRRLWFVVPSRSSTLSNGQ